MADSSAQVVSLDCNHCGASLDVQPGTRFVTCAHCGSRLEVHRSGGAAYTEVLDAIHQQTAQIAEDVDAIRRQNDIELLDREWAARQASLMIHDKHGRAHVPGKGMAVGASIFMALFGIVWTVFAGAIGGGLFALFGLIFVGMAIFIGVNVYRKAGEFERAQQEYMRRREELLRDSGRSS